MIPVELTLQGLYSYQEKQTIDFTRLTAAHLFGIFGQVGSGKSSVLEAITFAIYGRTDRLNQSGDNRNYNMMNLKSNELLIDFVFEAGRDQQAYRALVKGKRNSKRFDDVKTLDRTAYKKNGNEWLPIQPEQLETAIGLSYDNFRRTIIIPQGQFQEFLQLKSADRTRMMKELFNLDKFEFSEKVSVLESKNNSQIQILEGQKLQLGPISHEQLETCKAQLKQLEIELKEENRQLSEARKTEEDLRKLHDLTMKKGEAAKALNALLEEEPSVKQLGQKLARYEQCIVQFKHLLDDLKSNAAKLEAREKQIRDDETKLKNEETEISRLTKQLDELKPDYNKRELLKQRTDELNRLLRIIELDKEIDHEEERLKNGASVFNLTVQQIDFLRQSLQKKDEEIGHIRKLQPDMALLSNVKAWRVENKSLEKQLDETNRELEKCRSEVKNMEQELEKVLRLPIFSEMLPPATDEEGLAFLQKKKEQHREEQKILGEQENHLRVKAGLNAYSEGLEDGQPCPLCGALHHPEIFKASDLDEAISQLKQKKQILEQQHEQIISAENQLKLTGNQKLMLERQLFLWLEKQHLQSEQIDQHSKKFVWEMYHSEAEQDQAFQEAERLQTELKTHESQKEEFSKTLFQEEKNKERYQTEIESIRTKLTVYKTEKSTLAKQLLLIDQEQYRLVSPALIGKEKEDLLYRYERLEKEYTDLNSQLTLRSRSRDVLSGSILNNRGVFEQEMQTQAGLQTKIDEHLSQSNFGSLSEVQEVLSENLDIEMLKNRLSGFNELLMSSRLQFEKLQKEIGDRNYNAVEHQKVIEELNNRSISITQKNQEQGRLSELQNKLEKDLKSQADLQTEIAKLELRAENIRTMKSLFKASGFVNYISSVYLQNLCNAANNRFFQLTRQKLSLEITPDNSFEVRDYLNGGKARSVKTLSGGQTFQAALSLALALADNIQKITESNQNFFFLDEGFGSLDKESLAVVFDTLKSLRRENRIVGVISHVEEMQQEIDVHLRIEPHDEKGSIIRPSWIG